MTKPKLRKSLSHPGLLTAVRKEFKAISETKPTAAIPLADHLMSGLAIFSLKYPSLLQFDNCRHDAIVRHNLQTLYGIEQAPCDTYLRERLDEVDPRTLRKAFKRAFSLLQRGKGLEGFTCLDGHYLLSVDGTGYFSSNRVHCDHCCEKHHRDGHVSYYHQLLGAVLVHPDHREVFPLAPEPILKGDGDSKNDCERNAAKRLLKDLRREHPHLKLIVVEDSLASNGPHIRLLQDLNLRFILGAKQSDHQYLFQWVNSAKQTQTYAYTDASDTHHRFRFLNGVPLNDANYDLEVNFIEYWETLKSGKKQHFAWVTDLAVETAILMPLMRAGRARWRIENETYNTLKNQGYHFEHNFGHGYKHLSTVMAYLMMLAFLLDQIQQRCCSLFQRAMEKEKRHLYFWQRVRALFLNCLIANWQTLYRNIVERLQPQAVPYFDTS